MPEPASNSAPEFLAETVEELRSFFHTLTGFARHPLLFSRAWASGEARAMNPLGFAGTGVGAGLAARAIADHFRPPDADAEHVRQLLPTFAWLADLFSSQLPLAGAVLFALVVHARLRKRSGAPFRASLGAVLFADGTVSLVRAALTLAVIQTGPEVAAKILSAPSLLSLALTALALSGVHRLKHWGQAVAPLLLASLALGLATLLVNAPLIASVIGEAKAGRSGKTTIGLMHLEVTRDRPDAGAAAAPAGH